MAPLAADALAPLGREGGTLKQRVKRLMVAADTQGAVPPSVPQILLARRAAEDAAPWLRSYVTDYASLDPAADPSAQIALVPAGSVRPGSGTLGAAAGR